MSTIFSNESARADFVPTPLFVSLEQACTALGLATQTGRNMLSRGDFPVLTVRLGGRRLVPWSELEAFAQRLTQQAKDEAQPQPKPSRGHPGKAAVLARRAAAGGEQ